jgi:hypothetical protein
MLPKDKNMKLINFIEFQAVDFNKLKASLPILSYLNL